MSGKGCRSCPSLGECVDRAGPGGGKLLSNCLCRVPTEGRGCEAINRRAGLGAVTFPAGQPCLTPGGSARASLGFAPFPFQSRHLERAQRLLLTPHQLEDVMIKFALPMCSPKLTAVASGNSWTQGRPTDPKERRATPSWPLFLQRKLEFHTPVLQGLGQDFLVLRVTMSMTIRSHGRTALL